MSGFGEDGFSTRQVHVGADAVGANPRALPIHLTAGFRFGDFDEAATHFGSGDGFGYTRTGNPTIDAVERKLASLESGVQAVLVASGQAAVSIALVGLLSAGDHAVVSNHIYEGTRGLLLDLLSRFGIRTDFVDDIDDPEAWRRAIRPNTRALFAESIANARNDLLDIAAVAAVGDEHGIPLVIDNTLATPYLVRPLEHGAAVVVHSASKFLAGQGSVLGGVVVDDGRFDVERSRGLFPHLYAASRTGGPSFAERYGSLARAAYFREAVAPRFGPTISPLNAFLIGQGIETLSLRVRQQSANALEIARWLEARPEVASVDYVGLTSHRDHALAERYLPRGSGSVFQFTLRGGIDAARTVIDSVRVFTHMTHLGDIRSLVLHPGTTSHSLRTDEEKDLQGVGPGTLRVSIGIEDLEDLLADLDGALRATTAGSIADQLAASDDGGAGTERIRA